MQPRGRAEGVKGFHAVVPTREDLSIDLYITTIGLIHSKSLHCLSLSANMSDICLQ